MEREVQLLSSEEPTSKGENAVVANECFELASQIVAVEPVDHVATVTGTKSYCSSHIDFGHVLFDPVHDVNEIVVWCTTPIFPDVKCDQYKAWFVCRDNFLPDSIRERLTISCRACDVRGDDHV